MPPRLRIRELMAAHGFATAYELAKAANGRLSQRTAYRLVEADGIVGNFSATTLEALAQLFHVPVGELFETAAPRKKRR